MFCPLKIMPNFLLVEGNFEDQQIHFKEKILVLYFFLQNAILIVLKEASRLNSDLLRSQVEDVKHKHREDR